MMATHTTIAENEEHREESMVTNTIVIAALMILLYVTHLAYKMDLGNWNLPIAMAIAVIKGSMVLMIFMHVRVSPKIVWIFAIGSFLWLVLMIAGFENDYIARHWDGNYAHDFVNSEAAVMVQAQ
jgi:cytochrome c oxidase subunit 4